MPTQQISSTYEILASPYPVTKKRVMVKAYTRLREYLGVVPEASVTGFTKEINEGLGECYIRVGVKFDSANAYLQEGNHFEIWISDVDTLATQNTFRKIYQGYVSSIEPSVDSDKEYVDVRVLGYQVLLGLDVLGVLPITTLMTEDPDGVVSGYDATTNPPTACDIGLVARGIIDRFQVESGSTVIQYSTESIPVFSETMIYLFVQRTYAEAIAEVLATAPSGTYTYLDENGIFNFKQAGDVSHSFVFGKEVGNVKIRRNIDQLRNVILIWDGLDSSTSVVYEGYEDVVSVEKYGRRIERLTNSGIQDTDTADLIAAKFLAENSEPIVSITFDVYDNAGNERGYDIETISPGDFATFHNFSIPIASILREDMIVTSVVYSFDKATVTVQPVRSGITDIQKRLKNEITNTRNISTMPTTYST